MSCISITMSKTQASDVQLAVAVFMERFTVEGSLVHNSLKEVVEVLDIFLGGSQEVRQQTVNLPIVGSTPTLPATHKEGLDGSV
jgi:hypothetical protein